MLQTKSFLRKLFFMIACGISVILAGGCAKGSGETAGTTFHEEDISIAMDGYEVPATICIPDGDGPFPAVVMLHGTGSNRREAVTVMFMLPILLRPSTGLPPLRLIFREAI